MVWRRTGNLVVTAVALATSAGCLGPLSYRPPKPKAVAAPVKKEDNLHLPAVPDLKANNATLAGIDTTGAGVRDDIHIRIFSNYSSPAKRAIMMEIGKALQTVMAKAPKTADEAKTLQQPLTAALLKLPAIPGVNEVECQEMASELYLATVNTTARSKAFLQHSLLVPAESWNLPIAAAFTQAAAGATAGTAASSLKVAAAPAPAVVPVSPAAAAPVPGKTPGYGATSVYGSLDNESVAAAPPAGSTASKPAPAIPQVVSITAATPAGKETAPGTNVPVAVAKPGASDAPATSAATPTGQAPEKQDLPAPAASKPLVAPAATPVDDGFLEP